MITLQEIHERDKRPPSVTVNMTSYNHEKYLDEAIRGVLMQKTNFPVNIVIHDDASTDRSAEIIRRYASENPNITAIIEETNYIQNGKSFFPKVLPHLTGKYIAYCECDDFWIDENKLQIQVDYLESHPDHIAAYSNVLIVNKFSVHDPTISAYFKWHRAGSYPKYKLMIIEHQLASLLIRNFWHFLIPEELDYYLNVKANGDEKLFALLLQLGRVYHFSEQFAAYRRVTDEGDSYNARLKRLNLSKYDSMKRSCRQYFEIYVMIEHLFKKKYCRKYFEVLWYELKGRIKFHRSVIRDAKMNQCYELKNMPWYVWPLFPFYVVYKVFHKTGKILRKILGIQA